MTAQDPLERIKEQAAKSAADGVMRSILPKIAEQAAEKAARSVVTQRDYERGVERGLRIWLAGRSKPVSPRFAGRLAIYNPTPATIAAARAAGVMVDPAVDAEWVAIQMQRRARHQDTLAEKGLVSPARALREQRRSLELAARARGIRAFPMFATDADAIAWLKARLAPKGGDAA